MISRIEGRLVAVHEDRVEVQCEALTYLLLVPRSDIAQLSTHLGEPVRFSTLHYLEGVGQGSSFTPRLIGFSSADQRAFFEVFTTVKGLGPRKALRALQLPYQRIAEAIAGKDLDLLKSLPEIGKRTAETIVAELSGKVDRFIEMKPGGKGEAAAVDSPQAALIREAVGVLTSLGENKLEALQLVERAVTADPEITTAEQAVAAAYRLKQR